MPRDGAMQKAHEALVKDGWAEFPAKPPPTNDVVYLKPISDGSLELEVTEGWWVLYYIKNPQEEGRRVPLARFEHLPEASEHLTWPGKL